jgi:glycine/D-amino acid oxidase-like deaminating enzyme
MAASFSFSASAAEEEEPPVLIVGGGMWGAATSFYLAREHAVKSVVLELESPACAASGKAGGFLALDWTDSQPRNAIVRPSFRLHEQLAAEFGHETVQFRKLPAYQVIGDRRHATEQLAHEDGGVSWLNGRQFGSDEISPAKSSAQVHPQLLTEQLLRKAFQTSGSTVLRARAHGLGCHCRSGTWVVDSVKARGTFRDITPTDTTVPTDTAGTVDETERVFRPGKVVFCLGPWASLLSQWLIDAGVPADLVPNLTVTGARAHSIVFRPKPSPELLERPAALFLDYVADDASLSESPEVFPRPDGSVYVCGASDDVPLPDHPAAVVPHEDASARLFGSVRELSSSFHDAPTECLQACYLPLTSDDQPVVGPLELVNRSRTRVVVNNAFVASGGGCWGILMAPGVGKWLAAAICGKPSEVFDGEPFRSCRFGSVLSSTIPARGAKQGVGAHNV